MKINIRVLLVTAAIGLCVSAGTEKTSLTKGYRIGDLAPEIESVDGTPTILFTNPSGQYTLLNFWAAYNAVSRLHNVQLWHKINDMNPDRIRMYSVSLDGHRSVYEGTLKFDEIYDTDQIIHIRGIKSQLDKTYNLASGFGNFLVNDRGVIVATNVHPDDLDVFLN